MKKAERYLTPPTRSHFQADVRELQGGLPLFYFATVRSAKWRGRMSRCYD